MKIWFQNRRAKERKQVKKREEMLHKEKLDVHPHGLHPQSISSAGAQQISMSHMNQQIDTKPNILGLE